MAASLPCGSHVSSGSELKKITKSALNADSESEVAVTDIRTGIHQQKDLFKTTVSLFDR